MSNLWFRIQWAYYGFRYAPLDTSSAITLTRMLVGVKLEHLERGIDRSRSRLEQIMMKDTTLIIPRDTFVNASLVEQQKPKP